MGLSRRSFLAGAIAAGNADWRQARDWVWQGKLGRVVFCRVSAANADEAAKSLSSVFGGIAPLARDGDTWRYRDFVAAYQDGPARLVICGSEATLVVDAAGCRRFAC